jgi:hypothetical protein
MLITIRGRGISRKELKEGERKEKKGDRAI